MYYMMFRLRRKMPTKRVRFVHTNYKGSISLRLLWCFQLDVVLQLRRKNYCDVTTVDLLINFDFYY